MSEADPPRVLILGAASQIAEAIARLYAQDGARLVLAGRNGGALAEIAGDLAVRGAADVAVFEDDLSHSSGVAARFAAMASRFDGVDVVLLMYAAFEDQSLLEAEPEHVARVLQTNLVSAAQWAMAAAAFLEAQRSGVLIAGGAIAGDRGRRSNYVYGAGKAGLATLMQGVAHRLHASGARAAIVKFGPVASPMTRGQAGCASAQSVAREVKHAIEHGSQAAFYAPWWWRFAMWPIRLAPDFVMHRTRL